MNDFTIGNTPKISIVIPVYNTENEIDKCMTSILSQVYSNFEVILVDDGSTDKSYDVCCKYEKRYEFVRVLHQNNAGPSVARNNGINVAKGKYITFVDSDDFVSPNYLECLMKLIETNNADIAVVGLKKVYSYNTTIYSTEKMNGDVLVLSGSEAVKNMLYQKNIDTSPCGLLIELKNAQNHPFPPGRYHEDDFTTYQYYLDAGRVAVYCEPLYYYYQRPNSIMHSQGKVKNDELDAVDHLVDVFSQYGDEFKKAAESKRFSDYCQVLLTCPDMRETDLKTYCKIVSYLNKTKWQIIKDNNTRLKNKIAAASLFFGVKGLTLANCIKTKSMGLK